MKYSSYFKEKLNSEGFPSLSTEQFKRYVSIIDIEKSMLEIEKGKKAESYTLDDLYRELQKLTHNTTPIELYSDLMSN